MPSEKLQFVSECDYYDAALTRLHSVSSEGRIRLAHIVSRSCGDSVQVFADGYNATACLHCVGACEFLWAQEFIPETDFKIRVNCLMTAVEAYAACYNQRERRPGSKDPEGSYRLPSGTRLACYGDPRLWLPGGLSGLVLYSPSVRTEVGGG